MAGGIIINKSLWGQEMWKDIWAHLQEPEADLVVFHISVHKAYIFPVNQEADALSKMLILATDLPVDTADCINWKSGHYRMRHS